MVQAQWKRPPLTRQEADDLFMLTFADDPADTPRVAMDDLRFWAMSTFAHCLQSYARRQRLAWYVTSLLPIAFDCPGAARKRTVTPDTFVAFAADHPRTSYDVAAEGGTFPPFVLEVASPSSIDRDQQEKRRTYELLGAREYALFTPREGDSSTLEGYHSDSANRFMPWLPDEHGRLWSAVLGLHIVVRGPLLQAQTAEGQLLPTPEESEAARQRAEQESAQLRSELNRYRSQHDG